MNKGVRNERGSERGLPDNGQMAMLHSTQRLGFASLFAYPGTAVRYSLSIIVLK